MKTIFTSIFALFIASSVYSQTTHTINAGSFYYDPEVLTIAVGDLVNWVNDGGTHNVNAQNNSITGASFGNPESFISSPTTGANLYTHTFTVLGEYNYDCSVGSHAVNGMTGVVIVEENTSSVNETAHDRLNRTFHVFKSKYSNSLYVQFDAFQYTNQSNIQLMSMDGKVVFSQEMIIEKGKNVQNIVLDNALTSGIYIVNLYIENTVVSKKIAIQ